MNRMVKYAMLISTAGAFSAGAAVIEWSGASSTTFSTGSNWVNGTAPINSVNTDQAKFSSTTSGRMPNVTANRSINKLVFDSRNWELNSSDGVVLSLGDGGIEIQAWRTVDMNVAINPYAATWVVNQGAVLNVNKAVSTGSTGRNLVLSGGGTVNVNATFDFWHGFMTSSNKIVLGGSNLLGQNTRFNRIGILDLNGYDQKVWTYGKTEGEDIIDFGSTPGNNSMTFIDAAASWGSGWLTIRNFEAGDTLRFGDDASGLTASQLEQIRFDTGTGYIEGAVIDSSGYVTAIPEPANLGLIGLGGVVMSIRRFLKS